MRFIYAFILALTTGLVSAQITPLARAELAYERDFYVEEIFNCGKHGVVLSTAENPKRAERDPDRMFILFDTNLIETHTLDINIPFRQKLTSSYQDGKNVHLFYYDSRFGQYTVLIVSPTADSSIRFTGKISSRLTITGLGFSNNRAVLFHQGKRGQGLIVIDLKKKTLNSIDIKKMMPRSNINLVSLKRFKDDGEIYAIVEETTRTSKNSHIYIINQQGQLSKSYKIDIAKNIYFPEEILDASIDKMQNGNIVVSGSYSSNSTVRSEGIFFAMYNDSGLMYAEKYPLSKFDNYYSYLSDRQQKSIMRRKENLRLKDKSFPLEAQLRMHPIAYMGNKFVLTAEIYEATYRTDRTTIYIGGRPSTSTTNVFDGYQYSHAVSLILDENGAKVKDISFPITLWRKPYDLSYQVHSNASDTSLNLVYIADNTINSVIFSGYRARESMFDLQAGENDVIRFTKGKIEYWFDNYFISSGYQSLKNLEGNLGSRKRDVFYMQKVEIK